MNRLLISIVLVSFSGCRNTSPQLAIRKQEQLEMKFAPSFIPFLMFNLTMEKDSGEVTYYTLRPRNPLTGVPTKTIVYDSITLKVGGETYLKFAKTIRELDYKNYKDGTRAGEEMLDGLYAHFQYISASSDTTKLSFQSSNRKDTKIAYELIDGFFEFAETVFKENKTRLEYIGQLKKYFDYKLMHKKLN
jgi:hypothetical protein